MITVTNLTKTIAAIAMNRVNLSQTKTSLKRKTRVLMVALVWESGVKSRKKCASNTTCTRRELKTIRSPIVTCSWDVLAKTLATKSTKKSIT